MRVFVLGATGQVGRQVARCLTGLERVSDLVVAGRDLRRAREVADEVGATAAAVAAEDEVRFTTLLSDVDVLVNVSGPDASVLLPALRSGIRSGTSYCDISADGKTIEAALDLHERAVSAGVTAVVGIGSSPGFTNLLCRHAVSQLDETEAIRFGYLWECPQPPDARRLATEMRSTGRVDASWETLFRYVAGPVRIVRAGNLVDVDPWANPQSVDLLEGGAFTGFPVGSAEAVTLARNLPGVRELAAVVSMFPATVNQLWQELGTRVAAGAMAPAEAVIQLHEALAETPDGRHDAPDIPRVPLGLNAAGRRQGERVLYRAQPTDLWMETAFMASAGCEWLLEEPRQPGVFAPEAVLEPLPLFASAARIWGARLPGDRLLTETFSPIQGS